MRYLSTYVRVSGTWDLKAAPYARIERIHCWTSLNSALLFARPILATYCPPKTFPRNHQLFITPNNHFLSLSLGNAASLNTILFFSSSPCWLFLFSFLFVLNGNLCKWSTVVHFVVAYPRIRQPARAKLMAKITNTLDFFLDIIMFNCTIRR